MSISGLGQLFPTQNTEEIAGIQRICREREAEGQKSPNFSPGADSLTISAEAYRMAQAMRENTSSPNNGPNDAQSGTKSGLPPEADSSKAENAAGISITENGVLTGATARPLPASILARSEKNLAEIIDKGTKVLFEFGGDGSISLKPGLLREDYLRAQAILREWGISEPGLGF